MEIYDNSFSSAFQLNVSKKENKLIKMKRFFKTLEFCISGRYVTLASIVFPYPLSKEEYLWKIDEEEKTFSVSL